jgi:hypothetical protein
MPLPAKSQALLGFAPPVPPFILRGLGKTGFQPVALTLSTPPRYGLVLRATRTQTCNCVSRWPLGQQICRWAVHLPATRGLNRLLGGLFPQKNERPVGEPAARGVGCGGKDRTHSVSSFASAASIVRPIHSLQYQSTPPHILYSTCTEHAAPVHPQNFAKM